MSDAAACGPLSLGLGLFLVATAGLVVALAFAPLLYRLRGRDRRTIG